MYGMNEVKIYMIVVYELLYSNQTEREREKEKSVNETKNDSDQTNHEWEFVRAKNPKWNTYNAFENHIKNLF